MFDLRPQLETTADVANLRKYRSSTGCASSLEEQWEWGVAIEVEIGTELLHLDFERDRR